MRDQVKARTVAGSLVVTLTRPIAEETGIREGDPLLLETVSNGRILIRKEITPMSPTQRLELELQILKERKGSLDAESDLALWEYSSCMPTAHSGIDDPTVMEGTTRHLRWEVAKLDVAIAEKRLELFECGGDIG